MAILTFLKTLIPGTSSFSLSKLVIILTVLLAIIGAVCGVSYVSYEKGYQAKEREDLQTIVNTLNGKISDLVAQQEIFNNNVKALNMTLANHSQTVKIINTVTEKEIEKPVYRDTPVPATGMQLLSNNATSLNSARTTRSGDGKVSTTPRTSSK